jgi:hypothetical protein
MFSPANRQEGATGPGFGPGFFVDPHGYMDSELGPEWALDHALENYGVPFFETPEMHRALGKCRHASLGGRSTDHQGSSSGALGRAEGPISEYAAVKIES